MTARWALVLLAACGGPFAVPPPDGPFDFPDGFGFPDAPQCATTCGATCVDLTSDPMHCGSCDHACPTSMPACFQSNCEVPDLTAFVEHFGGAAPGDVVAGVATDGAGNLYVTGALVGSADLGGGVLASAGASDIFVASYTASGAYRWAKVFGGAGVDLGTGIAVTDRVSVVATFTGGVDFGGTTLTSAGGTDIVFLELDANSGDAFTSQRYGTPGDDVAFAIAASQVGEIVIAGAFGAGTLDLGGVMLAGASAQGGFFAVLGLDGSGIWARQIANASSTDTSACRAVAIDNAGNIVVAGAFSGTVNLGSGIVTAQGNDGFVASFDSGGGPRWARSFGGPGDDSANAVVIDPLGNVLVGGSYHGAVDFGTGPIPGAGTLDGFVAGYTAQGQFQLARHLGAATSSAVTGLGVTSVGLLVATGLLEGAADLGTGPLAALGGTDVFVAGFGGISTAFAKRYGGPGADQGTAISIGPNDRMVIGGRFQGTVDLGAGSIPGGASDNGFVMVISP